MTSLSLKIATNTLVQFVGKFMSTILGVAITFLLTHYLDHESYGIYVFSLVFVTIFGSIADWGLSLITVREASKNPQEANLIIGNSLVIRLVLALVGMVLAIIIINLSNYDPQVKIVTSIASLYLLALSIKTSFQIIFQTKLEMSKWAISELSANALTIILLVFLIQTKAGLPQIIMAFLAGNFLSAAVAAYLGQKMLPLRLNFITKTTKYLIIEAVPMGAILVLFSVYNRIDTVILSHYMGADVVADYGLAYRIFEVVVLGAAYFSNSILPLISNLANHDNVKLGIFFKKAFVVLMFMGVGAAICTWIFSPFAVSLLGGKDYQNASIYLRVLSLALIVSYFNHLGGYTLIALGKQWASVKIAIIALIVNISLNIILIPKFSATAAAFNTFITEFFIVIMTLVVIRRTIKVTPTLRDVWEVSKEAIIKKGHIF